MIEIKHVYKSYDDIDAVSDVSVDIREKQVFGMIGTNGAGKSTLLRLMSGVMKPDKGEIHIDGENVYNNVSAKEKLFFIADEPYFFNACNPMDMAKYYKSVYKDFDETKLREYLKIFDLEEKRKIRTFSKGMKKQLAILLAISSNTKYIYFDETFDGLDPVMRQGVKSIMASEMEERGMTPIVASHNLRELEDICDHVGLLHKGGVLLSKDIEDLKLNIQKVQCVFSNMEEERKIFSHLQILKSERRGQLLTLTIRGAREEVENTFAHADTVFYEIIPLSLEEIFISETEVVGYDIKKLILS